MADRNGWISTNEQLPPKDESLLIVARHEGGFSTILGWDTVANAWMGDGGFPVDIEEFTWWKQIPHPAIVEDEDRAFQAMKEAVNG